MPSAKSDSLRSIISGVEEANSTVAVTVTPACVYGSWGIITGSPVDLMLKLERLY